MSQIDAAQADGQIAPKLRIRDLTKRFDGKEVLHHLDFDVYDGEFLSILGQSGCGKTTTLRILIGLIPCDGGSIELDGRDITHARPSDRSMGIVFQNYALFENMTVRGNVATLADGTIAGSVTDLAACVRHAVREMDVPLEDAVLAATLTPARAIGIYGERGSIEVGKVADLVVLDEDLNVKHVVLRGTQIK